MAGNNGNNIVSENQNKTKLIKFATDLTTIQRKIQDPSSQKIPSYENWSLINRTSLILRKQLEVVLGRTITAQPDPVLAIGRKFSNWIAVRFISSVFRLFIYKFTDFWKKPLAKTGVLQAFNAIFGRTSSSAAPGNRLPSPGLFLCFCNRSSHMQNVLNKFFIDHKTCSMPYL